jgi:hypothetical protein
MLKARRMGSSPIYLFSCTHRLIRTQSTVGAIGKAKYYGNGREIQSNLTENKKQSTDQKKRITMIISLRK